MKKRILKTIALLGVAGTGVAMLGSCQKTEVGVNSIIPMNNYQSQEEVPSSVKLASTNASTTTLGVDFFKDDLATGYVEAYSVVKIKNLNFGSLYGEQGDELCIITDELLSDKTLNFAVENGTGKYIYMPILDANGKTMMFYRFEVATYASYSASPLYDRDFDPTYDSYPGGNVIINFDIFGYTDHDWKDDTKVTYSNFNNSSNNLYYGSDSFVTSSTQHLIHIDSLGYDYNTYYPYDSSITIYSTELDYSNNNVVINNALISEGQSNYSYPLDNQILVSGTQIEVNADITYPDFDNVDVNIPVDINHPVSVEEIISNIHATDETDGDISNNIQLVSTTYDPESIALGTYDLVLRVSDAAGNSTQATFKIVVYDITDPTITAVNKTVSYNAPLTSAQINQLFTFSDNYGTPTFEIVTNNYTANSGKLGTYSVTARVTDLAGNTATATAKITVEDKLAPVITAPASIDVATSKLLTLEEIRSKITVTDGYDGAITNYTVEDKDGYYSNSRVVGSYDFIITAKDSSGNVSTFTITVNTLDDVAPDFWVYSDYVITITKGEALTKAQIISFLSQIGEIDAANVLSVEFDSNALDTEGMHDVNVLMKDGTTYKAKLSVAAADVEEPKDDWTKIFTEHKFIWIVGGVVIIVLIGGAIIVVRKKKQ